MPKTEVMITRPDHDLTTHYFFQWSQEIVNTAESKHGSDSVVDIKKYDVTKNSVCGHLIKNKPSVVIFNGHGNEVSIMGQKEIIIDMRNLHLLKNKRICCRSCRCGVVLGKMAVEQQNAEAFIGYLNDFVFPYDKNKVAETLKDDISRPVLEASNIVAISLAKGNNPEEAQEKSMKVYDKWIKWCKKSKDIEAPNILKYLLWNRSNQVLIQNL